jgi:biotin-dependent carboxylase-like uncharacterized protein
MDGLSLRIGNDLVGNPPDAAGLECCLPPAEVRFDADAVIALTGADCAARLEDRELRIGHAVPVRAGQILRLGSALVGCRAYLCVAGGIDVPVVLGSRATDLQAAIGGLEGRLLRRDDVLKVGAAPPPRPARAPVLLPQISPEIRALPGPEFEDFDPAARDALFAASWIVTAHSNRMGYRLAGAMLSNTRTGEMKSHAVFPGTIQVPAGGTPIALMADAQATGGYPRIAVVIAADHWRLAQVAPGTAIRFVRTDRAGALRALHKQRSYLQRIHGSLHAD